MPLKICFTVNNGDTRSQVKNEELVEYANLYGLEDLIPNRYSWLFVFDLMLGEKRGVVSPDMVIDEIKNLEDIKQWQPQQTKPASEFERAPLKGLWHKHFFSSHPSILAHNMRNHLAGGKLERLVEEVFDQNKSSTVTTEMLNELSHRIVVEPLEARANSGRLTGEWIVFAKHQGQNYYLCLASHKSGDETIAHNIKLTCLPQFPFLRKYPLAHKQNPR